jgi:Tol biopolymer transport system component
LRLAAVLAALLLALAGTADPVQAKNKKDKRVEKIVFASDRTTGTGVTNPTGEDEIFVMNPDGTQLKQLTFNTAADFSPTHSPDGQKIVFTSSDVQSTNTQGDREAYLMKADGSGQQNITNTAAGIEDSQPGFSPGGKKIAFKSLGTQSSNPEGDDEIYVMNTDGSSQRNLTDPHGATSSTSVPTTHPTARRSPTTATATSLPTPRKMTRYTR